MSAWNTDQIPDQTGRRGLVTGASSGLGEITAYELARKGALVEVRELDLSSLESGRAFATGLVARSPTLDLLVNNAGIMMTPASRTNADRGALALTREEGSCRKRWMCTTSRRVRCAARRGHEGLRGLSGGRINITDDAEPMTNPGAG